MASRTAIRQVESFHLAFLRALEGGLDRAAYVVKGGVNLRAWFGSPRCSEDLDLDAVPLAAASLESRVDSVLAGKTLKLLLGTLDLAVTRQTKPKPTETTQRWKLQVRAGGTSLPLHTKIEFSRRPSDEAYLLEPVLAEVVQPYGLPAPSANHYGAAAAIRQKIRALAGRAEVQARDIFDLDHLIRRTRADAGPWPADASHLLALASERVLEMPFASFRSQVIPYLDEEHRELHDSSDAWDRLREVVLDELARLGR